MLSAVRATSGVLRFVVEPLLAVMLMFVCQFGIGYCVLIPPPLPKPSKSDPNSLPQFQTVSEIHEPPGPLVVKVVPPTCVTYGESPGKSINPV